MHMKRLSILATLLILTACTVVEAPTAAPSPTSTASVTPTATATASVTPSITASPTATEIQSTPDFLALPISNDPLFAPGLEVDCQLPCWQGLRIGEADREDIQQMFDDVFGFDGSIDVFQIPIEDGVRRVNILDVPGMQAGGYTWSLESTETDLYSFFYLYTLVDENTDRLAGIQITTASFLGYSVPTIQEITQELGLPSYVYLDIQSYNLVISMLYKDGIAIQMTLQQAYPDVSTLCFNEMGYLERYSLLAPFESLDESQLTVLQKNWLLLPLDDSRPVEDVLDITIEEFVNSINSDDPCIEVPRQ